MDNFTNPSNTKPAWRGLNSDILSLGVTKKKLNLLLLRPRKMKME